jgi:hypothetical protein
MKTMKMRMKVRRTKKMNRIRKKTPRKIKIGKF